LRKKYSAKQRKNNAKKWLQERRTSKELVVSYAERYGVSEHEAVIELFELGYYEDIQIKYYEKQGIEWEYKFDGYTGDMKIVPKEIPDWELHKY
jgi:hypothetical protein